MDFIFMYSFNAKLIFYYEDAKNECFVMEMLGY